MQRFCALVLAVLALALVATESSASLASDDPQFNLHYVLRTEPSNPESPVAFTVSFYLTLEDVEEETIAGWHVDQVRFKQYDSAGRLIGVWRILDPTLNTTDGLWWVNHVNIDAPALSEFAVPPLIAGTADNENSPQPDLDVSFEGVDQSGSCVAANLLSTGVFNWAIRYSQYPPPPPASEGDDEPGDIFGPHDDTGDFCVEPCAT